MPSRVVEEGNDSDSSTNEQDSTEEPPQGSPFFSQIYTDAERYDKILAHTRDGDPKSPNDSAIDVGHLGGFADLVGRDLGPSEKAIAGRWAKLSVAGDSWTPGVEHDELNLGPGPHEALPPGFEITSDSEELDSPSEEHPEFDFEAPVIRRTTTTNDESWKLEPDEIVRLLVQEFGSLTANDEEEKVILETDGCLFQDVIVMGVIHLTTHRLAFHATLLSTRPDLLPSQQIIKAGPAVLHRKGWHVKRRLWIELSHDMICTYASSRDEDRIKPLRTVLLSCIKRIYPIDPARPTYLHLSFDTTSKHQDGFAEFDTEESAQDWKRELLGAIFLYRHRRREALDGTHSDESNGIRVSIPLHRITSFKFGAVFGAHSAVALHVRLSQSDINQDVLGNKHYQVVHITPIAGLATWNHLGDYIAAAKRRERRERRKTKETGQPEPVSPVFIDWGALSFDESGLKKSEVLGTKEKTIRMALALGPDSDVWIARAWIFRSICSSGYFVISRHYVGFWSKSLTLDDTRYRIPMHTVKCAKIFTRKLIIINTYGLAIELEGRPDIRFEFKLAEVRDEAIKRINAAVQTSKESLDSPPTSPASPNFSSNNHNDSLSHLIPSRSITGILAPLSRSIAAVIAIGLPESLQLRMPKAINLPREVLRARPSMHFVCLTIGSRGDVQPYIALGLGLMKEGHRVTICTHAEYQVWIEAFGIGFKSAGGDPGALMKLSVENKMFSPDFFRESLSNFRPWLDQLLLDAWEGCQGADVLLESPSAMAGVHIAEALGIPYFRTFTMPWTKTTQFPHAFLSPPVDAPHFNYASYVLFDNVLWAATSGQINRWRRHTLGLGNTDMGHLAQSKIIFIYNFSSAVVPKPLDWSDTVIISGYWFLDNPDVGWEPPRDLLDWMKKARDDQKPIVYIGFGSITVPHPNHLTAHIVKAVLKSGVRAIISKGWSARMSSSKDDGPPVEIPPECFALDKIPHDWLFPRIDAAMHHGGAGTTGASLRAGIPTLIKPWFGDQYFWASRVQKLGAGLKVAGTRANDIADALTKGTTNRIMKEKAAAVGVKIRAEDGVHTAIHAIYTYLPRASRDRTSL